MGSLHNLGHDVELIFGHRRVGRHRIRHLPVRDLVFARLELLGHHARHGLDVDGIHLIELLNPLQNLRQLPFEAFGLRISDLDTGETRDAPDGL